MAYGDCPPPPPPPQGGPGVLVMAPSPLPPQDRRVHWKVKVVKSRRHVSVHADYYRVECGVLYFRNSNNGGYPTPVAVFAPGHWLEIKNADVT